MDGVFFFHVEVVFVFFGVRGGAGDLIDGHLAEHGSEIGCSFEGFLLFKVIHLFDGAGVECYVFVLGHLFFDLDLRRVGDGGLVEDGRGGFGLLVMDGSRGWLKDGCFRDEFSGGGEGGDIVQRNRDRFDAGGLPVPTGLGVCVDGGNWFGWRGRDGVRRS